MAVYDYWQDSVEVALDVAGVECTPEQLLIIAQSIGVSVENEGMARGRDCIPNPLETELRRVREAGSKELRKAQEKAERDLEEKDYTIRRLQRRADDLACELEQARRA